MEGVPGERAAVRGALPSRPPRALAFCTVWATGPDPTLDRVFRVLAMRPTESGWELFDRLISNDDEAASARMVREFGVSGSDLEGAPSPQQAFEDLREFLGEAEVVTEEPMELDPWCRALLSGWAPDGGASLRELVSLLAPGRLHVGGTSLVDLFRAGPRQEGRSRGVEPTDLVQGVVEVIRRFTKHGPMAAEVLAGGCEGCLRTLSEMDAKGARRLELLLDLIDRPSLWCRSTGGLFEGADGLEEGLLTRALERAHERTGLLVAANPRWQAEAEELEAQPPLPTEGGRTAGLSPQELSSLDEVFQVHLPALLAEERGLSPEECHRPAQHEVARAVGEVLGSGELLLVHAPTGTGKTLAYLIPSLLWARARGVRVGLATYTRALQEQAMEGEVPRALSGLARAGFPPGFRVALLKGREHYLCFRALKQVEPDDGDDAERWLAWTQLAVFALTDTTGDLDRLSSSAPIELAAPRPYRRALWTLLREVRSESGCCMGKSISKTCAGVVARRRAERSHVVVTNHAWVLSSPSFLRTVVFDECEHLHQSAASAREARLELDEVYVVLQRLAPTGSRGGPLRAVRAEASVTEEMRQLSELTEDLANRALQGMGLLHQQAVRYVAWRRDQVDERGTRSAHTLFGEYVRSIEPALGRIHEGTVNTLDNLLGVLRELHGRLQETERPRLRKAARSLEVLSVEVGVIRARLQAWLPTADGEVRLASDWWHEIEEGPGGDPVLVARPLAPHEILGSEIIPQLEAAAFLSATTHLRGSFESSRHYLGLDRAARPGPDEPREPRTVRTCHVEDLFDYSRVFVGIPKDAPPVREKARYLRYVAGFVQHLVERTRGRTLVLFTSLADCREVGEGLTEALRGTHLPVLFQGMPGVDKEELATRFRERTEAILLGVDTFWYGADFPGETLEYLVIARLPFGVPDAYHHAQQALLGDAQQRERIYMPRALAKFRQGFGRLMRRPTDRGCTFVLDRRIREGRNRVFLKELPTASFGETDGATLVWAETSLLLQRAFAHMGMLAELARKGQTLQFPSELVGSERTERSIDALDPAFLHGEDGPPPPRPTLKDEDSINLDPDELPF